MDTPETLSDKQQIVEVITDLFARRDPPSGRELPGLAEG
jgi:hypothetical protein